MKRNKVTEDEFAAALQDALADVMGRDVKITSDGDGGFAAMVRKTPIWPEVMRHLIDDNVQEYRIITDPIEYACDLPGCTDRRGVAIWVTTVEPYADVVKDVADTEIVSEATYHERENSLWIATVDGHNEEGTPVCLSLAALRKLRDALDLFEPILEERSGNPA